MITELGGISYRPDESNVRWYGYGTVDTEESLVEKYRELLEAVLDCPGISGFCYTQLTDTLQETNGLLTEDREFKVDPVKIREITRRPSAAAPVEAIGEMQKQAAAQSSSMEDATGKEAPA